MPSSPISKSSASQSNAPFPEWTPPQPEELTALLPGFSISALIGYGGMGAVYHGIQESLDRAVAIKLLPPELGKDPEFKGRFRREAKSMALLSHPNIVQIYDFGETDQGHAYFVMEYIDGCDMHQYTKNGYLDCEGALNAISQVCDALNYAHSKGIVHRDIKPANVFLNSDGLVKVGDFGLAKLVTGKENTADSELLGLTMTGIAMGTPHYVAPEQLIEGDHIDHRADLYSLGVMFYEMLTGRVPRGRVDGPSKVSAVGEIDQRIDDVVFQAMENDPDLRFPDALSFRRAIDSTRSAPLEQVSGIPAPDMITVPPQSDDHLTPQIETNFTNLSEEKPQTKNKMLAAGGGAVFLIGAVATALWFFASKPEQPKEPTIAPPEEVVEAVSESEKIAIPEPEKETIEEKITALAETPASKVDEEGMKKWEDLATANPAEESSSEPEPPPISSDEPEKSEAEVVTSPEPNTAPAETTPAPVIVKPIDPVVARLEEIEKKFRARYEPEVGDAYKLAVEKLNQQFATALNREKTAAAKAEDPTV